MAADGQISIDIAVDGTQVATANTALGTLGTSAQQAGGQTDALGQQTAKASLSIKDMAISLGLVAVGAKAFSILKSSLDSAISRFDTLIGFPRIMEQMGFSSEQAQKSINKLSEGIQGLPTTLDGIVKSAQNIAIMTGDLDTATDTALALNNAFLASGSSSADAERGLTQYVQMLSKGTVDMQSWKTLQETMGYGLNETAKAFGFTGAAAQRDLYATLKDGDITFDAFNAKIIELSDGVGGFAEVALTSSAGIGTSMQNLKNAVTVGVANMIVSFDNLSKSTTGKSIAENMDGLKVVIKAAFTVIGKAIEGAVPIVTVFASAITALIPVVKTLTPAIIGLVAAFATYAVIQKASTIISAANVALKAAQATTLALTVATSARTAAQVTMTTVDRAGMAVTVAQTGAVTLSTLAIGVMTGSITLATAAIAIKTTATLAWGAAIKFLMGPVGWIIAAIGLLVTGVGMLVKWFNKSTEEGERLGAVTTELADSTKALNDSLDGTSSVYEKNLGNIESTAHANTDLIAKIQELMAIEDKSAAQKKELESYVDSLNGSVEGLSLAYSKEANSLNLSSEEIANKIALMKEQETLMASQERFLEISKEQHEVEIKLQETNELRQEWNDKLEDGSVKSKEYKTAIAELDEQEAKLKGTVADLGDQHAETEIQITASIEAVAEATKNSVDNQVLSYEFLKDNVKDIVDDLKSTWEDYKKKATDMFDTLSEKSKLSVSEMTKNLEENQRVMANWADNIAILASKGIDEGLLDTLRSAGPESAGHVKALVNSSDAELMKLSDAFAKGGDVATSALSKSLGDNSAEVLDKVGHMVTQSGATLTQQIEKADFASLGKAMPEGTAKGVEEGTKEVTDATRKMAEDAEKEFRNSLEIKSPSGVFKKDGVHITEGVTQGVESGIPKVVSTMTKLYKAMIVPFANISTEFQKIGTFAGDGLVTGLKNSEGRVMATARGLANNVAATMRKALDTHSPSRVTAKIGEDTGQGLADGIENKQKTVDVIAEKMALSIVKITKSMNNKISTDTKQANIEIKQIESKARAESKQIAERTQVDINLIYAKAKQAKRKLTQTEVVRIQRLEEDSAKKIKGINTKSAEDIGKINAKLATDTKKMREQLAKDIADIEKKEFDHSKGWIAKKKQFNELSLKDELDAWERVQARYRVGSKEREEADLNVYNIKKEISNKLTSVNDDYFNKVEVALQKEVDSIKKLRDEYKKAEDDRTSALYSFAGIFDEIKKKTDVSGQQLIDNLKGQINTFAEWSANIKMLAERGIDEGLLGELRDMGPKAAAEIAALNSLSDSQLEEYASLWQIKSSQAREQAQSELEKNKLETEQKIDEIHNQTEKQLDKLQKEWQSKIRAIRYGTKDEFNVMKSDLNTIGKQSIQGMIDGLNSMEGALMDRARSIANAVKTTMQSALDINSPSGVMRDDVGRWIPEGIALGIKDNAKSVYKELDYLSRGMILASSPEQALGTSRMAYSGGLGQARGGSTTNNKDQSRKQENNININTYDSGAKELERTLRRLKYDI